MSKKKIPMNFGDHTIQRSKSVTARSVDQGHSQGGPGGPMTPPPPLFKPFFKKKTGEKKYRQKWGENPFWPRVATLLTPFFNTPPEIKKKGQFG